MGIVTYDDCISCHHSRIVNKDGYCDTCQERIDWFFTKGKDIRKKEISPFWQVFFFLILLGLGVALFLQGISGLF